MRSDTPEKPVISILVVDDDPAVRNLLDTALPHYGFAVTLAAGGTEAIHLYRRQHEGIGLVLLDVQMPGGPDGPQTLAALRGLNPQVRCCFMTGHSGLYSEDELLALGAVHVFPKP